MTDLRIDLELSSALQGLSDIKRKQIPFATALALTKTAQHAQDAVRRSLPHRFELRNDFVRRGVKIRSASKSSLEADVRWQAPVAARRGFAQSLARQETGGTKTPAQRWLAIPRPAVEKRRGRSGIIPKRWRPGQALKRKDVFIAKTQTPGVVAIYRRVTKKRYPIEALYTLTDRIRVRETFQFVPTARAAARQVFAREFGKAFAKALATRRR